MRELSTKGWEGMSEFPEKIFIERLGHSSPQEYEFSEYRPAEIRLGDLLEGMHSKQNFINLFYSLPEIFAPVNEIAWRVADATWTLRRTMDDAPDWKDKDFNRLFSQPNPFMDFKQFVYQAVCYEYLTGASYQFFNKPSVLANNYKNIANWMNLPSQYVTVEKNNGVDIYTATEVSDVVKSYKVKGRVFDVNNVLPLMQLDLNYGNEVDRYKSPLHGALMAIRNLIPVYEARGVIFVKRGALGFIVSKKKDDNGTSPLSPDEKREIQEEMQREYGLKRGKSQMGLTSVPVEFVRTSMSIDELKPFDETLADAVAIYAALRVPRHLVPSKDSSTFANADADLKSFYNSVIIPLAKRYALSWSNYMNIPNRYIDSDFSHVAILQENLKEKADTLALNTTTAITQYAAGIIKLNDRNAIIGVDAIPGGDNYIGSFDEPLITIVGVDGLKWLDNLLANTILSDGAKSASLVEMFGIDQATADKMVESGPKPDPIKQQPIDTSNNTIDENNANNAGAGLQA